MKIYSIIPFLTIAVNAKEHPINEENENTRILQAVPAEWTCSPGWYGTRSNSVIVSATKHSPKSFDSSQHPQTMKCYKQQPSTNQTTNELFV